MHKYLGIKDPASPPSGTPHHASLSRRSPENAKKCGVKAAARPITPRQSRQIHARAKIRLCRDASLLSTAPNSIHRPIKRFGPICLFCLCPSSKVTFSHTFMLRHCCIRCCSHGPYCLSTVTRPPQLIFPNYRLAYQHTSFLIHFVCPV